MYSDMFFFISQKVLVAEMKKRLKNQNQYAKKRLARTEKKTQVLRTHEECELSMQQEMEKENPSISILKKEMEACRKKRREEAKKSISSMAHLQDYPALRLPELVSRNFIYSVNFLL